MSFPDHSRPLGDAGCGISAARRGIVTTLVPVYLFLIWGVPAVAAVVPILLGRTRAGWIAAAAMAPVLWTGSFLITAALLSRLTLRALIPGKFPRDLGHETYGPRRLHALCWTSLYYLQPVYHLVLSMPVLKRLVFRSFGYKGSVAFTVYPDTWLRDLPLLRIGAGAYLANRATIGSNICLRSGRLLVAPIEIGCDAVIGHLAVIDLGDSIGPRVEIGVGSTLGMEVSVGANTIVGAIVGINHGASIGCGCRIGSMSYIGVKAVIGDGIHIRSASVVPDRAVVLSQSHADQFAGLAPLRAVALQREG